MFRLFYILSALLLTSFACEKGSGSSGQNAPDKPSVVVTTTMLGDVAKEIGGSHVNVVAIMKPGGDPHLYQPTPGDAKLIASAQLVITNGLHLEGWIDDLVRNAGGNATVVVATDGVEPIRAQDTPGGVDPHFWFDLRSWKVASSNVATAIKSISEPSTHASIDQNLTAYHEETDAVHAWLQKEIASIPESQRVLVTSHDAFRYFSRAYGIEVVPIQGLSTEQEASERDVVNVIEIVRAKNVPAIFIESSVNPALAKQVAKETGAKLVGPLYSDSIGVADSPAGTFLGTVRENTRIITEALGGEHVAHEFNDRERTR